MSVVMDRMKASLFALVKAATSRLAYAAPRFAKVVKATTAGDGSTTLDVTPEDPAFPSMGGIPLFHGLPAVTLTLAAGTRVLVEFSEADPARPFVRSWAGGESLTSLSIAGGPPAARVGDSVALTINQVDLAAIFAAGLAAGYFLPGSPVVPPPVIEIPIAQGLPAGTNEISSGSDVISLG